MNRTHSKRLLGAILLVAGTTIGAAVLAIPVSTGRAGFIPSIGVISLTWIYLVMAALFLLEVNLAFPNKGNIITMASTTLGWVGKVIGWSAYLFLLYALNTAYIAGTTSVLQDMGSRLFGVSLSNIVCILPLLIVFGLLMRFGMKMVDHINRIFMIGLLVTFCFLVILSLPHVQLERLCIMNPEYILPSLSVVVTAFGFHVIIPSLVTYLHGNVKELKQAIWIGSMVPLIGYLIWQCVTLGTTAMEGDHSLAWAYAHGKNGAQLIALNAQSSLIATLSEAFAIFAIITSFLGVSISLFDCLSDGLKIDRKSRGSWKLFVCTFMPPLYCAFAYPRIFFTALETAGAFGVIVLLALLPAFMCWQKRYRLHLESPYQAPGGKVMLIAFIALAIASIAVEVLVKTGYFGV